MKRTLTFPTQSARGLFLGLLLCLAAPSFAADNKAAPNNTTWELTELSLLSAIKESSPQLKNIQANLEQSAYGHNSLNQQYQWQWVTSASHSDSNEQAIAAFIPTFGPTYRYETGVQKKLRAGVSIDAKLFTDQQSTADKSIDEATRSGVTVGLSIDLWKNLFGRVDRAQLTDESLKKQKVKIESEINSHILRLELRKVYWSLVANSEQLKIAQALLKTSEKQLKDAYKRGKQYIADKGEIARYKAQVSSRKSTIKGLEYQRDLLIESLKQELPHLASHSITLGTVNVKDMYKNYYMCAEQVGSHTDVPWKNTKVDELLKIVDKSYRQKQIASSRYSDLDIQLTSEYQKSGVDNSYSTSYDNFQDDGRSGYQVGLQVTIPLGSSDSKAKRNLVNADYNRYLAEKNQLLGQVRARQTQVSSMVKLLQASVKNLKENGNNLAVSIKSSQRKFKQARISLNDLISEQDSLLNTRLTEVDTQLQVIHVLLNYFQTFTEDPCSINKIGV